MSDKDKVSSLNETITRLMLENKGLREDLEEVKILVRKGAPSTDGLTLTGSVKAIFKERDLALDRIQFFREEIRSVLKYLLESDIDDSKKANELRKRINQFLFKNRQ